MHAEASEEKTQQAICTTSTQCTISSSKNGNRLRERDMCTGLGIHQGEKFMFSAWPVRVAVSSAAPSLWQACLRRRHPRHTVEPLIEVEGQIGGFLLVRAGVFSVQRNDHMLTNPLDCDQTLFFGWIHKLHLYSHWSQKLVPLFLAVCLRSRFFSKYATRPPPLSPPQKTNPFLSERHFGIL